MDKGGQVAEKPDQTVDSQGNKAGDQGDTHGKTEIMSDFRVHTAVPFSDSPFSVQSAENGKDGYSGRSTSLCGAGCHASENRSRPASGRPEREVFSAGTDIFLIHRDTPVKKVVKRLTDQSPGGILFGEGTLTH